MFYDVLMKIRYHHKQIALIHHKQQHFLQIGKHHCIHYTAYSRAVIHYNKKMSCLIIIFPQIVGLMDDDKT